MSSLSYLRDCDERSIVVEGVPEMTSEVLVYTASPDAARRETAAAGVQMRHVLSPNVFVVAVPDEFDIASISSVTTAFPDDLDGHERNLANAWIARFAAGTETMARSPVGARVQPGWDGSASTSPLHLSASAADKLLGRVPFGLRARSSYLVGSVVVGVVVVSGPGSVASRVPISGSLAWVSASPSAVMGVNTLGHVYQRNYDVWTRVPGRLAQISVGSSKNVWGVNVDHEIFQSDGQFTSPSPWKRIAGSLAHVAAAKDGTVWGVNSSDEVFRLDSTRMPWSWERMPGSSRQGGCPVAC